MRIKAIVVRIIKHFLYDIRTMGLLLFAPLLILTLINLVLTSEPHVPRISLYSVPDSVGQALTNADAAIQIYLDKDEALEAVKTQETDALLDMSVIPPKIVLEGSNPTVSGATLRFIGTIFRDLKTQYEPFKLNVSYLHGHENMSLFDYGGSILVAFLAFFFVFLIAGVSFLRERTGGTLERLLGTPIRLWELVLGYILGFGIFVLLQVIIITYFAVEVLGVLLIGNMAHLIFVTVLVAMTALSLGMLLSSFAHNEFQIVQFIPVVIIPQLLFSGLFNEGGFPVALQILGRLMPVGYGARALGDIMLKGKSLHEIAPDVLALAGFFVVFSILNVVVLKLKK